MRSLAIAACAIAVVGAAWAAPVQKTVSLAPEETSVRDAYRSFAAQTGAKILIGGDVTGRVAMKLDSLPLESALSAASAATNNRWAKIALPAEKAETLTPEAAAALVSAAETLAAAGASVQPAGASAVSVGAAAPANSAVVYLVLPKADVVAQKAAREEARKKAQEQEAVAQRQQIAARLSPDARKDPQLVQAYTSLQTMQPDQIAMLAREYMIHSTPEQRQAIGEALQRQREHGGPMPD